MSSNRNAHLHSVGVTVIVLAALILGHGLAGCTPTTAEPVPKVSEESEDVPAKIAWKSDEVLVSDVQVSGDVAIAYRRQGPQMEVIARNLKNGKQLWKDEALGAADFRGIAPDIKIVEHEGENYVAYLGTKTGTYGQLKIADISNGTQYASKENFGYWGERPYICGKTFCTEGAKARKEKFSEYQYLKFDWSKKQWTEKTTKQNVYGLQQGGSRLGEGLIAYWDDSDREMLSYSKDPQTVWKRPYEQIFAKGFSTTRGWKWDTVEDNEDILLGYGSHAKYDFFDTDKKKAVYRAEDLSKFVALDANTGRTLWQQKGVATSCGSVMPWKISATGDTVVLCYYDGGKQTLTTTRKDHYRTKTDDLTWKAVGIDSKTGKRKWEYRLSDPLEHSKTNEGAGTPMQNTATSILPLEEGEQVVNNSDGSITPLENAVGANVLCTVERDSYYIYSATLGTKTPGTHKASKDSYFTDAQTVCKRGSWKPTDAVPNVEEFRRAGFTHEDVVVLSQVEGMAAYRLSGASQ